MRIGNLGGIADLRAAMPLTAKYDSRPLSHLGPDGPLRYLVIHHTASPSYITPFDIASYHIHTLGWPGIGYHFVVNPLGTLFYTGDILTIRYNVSQLNHAVIGICLVGDFTDNPPPLAQRLRAHDLCRNLGYALGWPVPVAGHRDIALPHSPTACPGNTWPSWSAYFK